MRERAAEVIAITVPVLIEVVAVVGFIMMLAVWSALATGQVPA